MELRACSQHSGLERAWSCAGGTNNLAHLRVIPPLGPPSVHPAAYRPPHGTLPGLPADSAAGASGGGAISQEVMRTLEREVGIMVKIRHPNVILFMGVCIEPPCVVTGERGIGGGQRAGVTHATWGWGGWGVYQERAGLERWACMHMAGECAE